MVDVYILVKMKRTKKVKITVLLNSQLFTDLIFSNFSLNKFVKLQKYPVSRSENFEQMVESGGSNQSPPPRMFLLYLWSNYNQSWHNDTLSQNLSKALKVLMASSRVYDTMKQFLL